MSTSAGYASLNRVQKNRKDRAMREKEREIKESLRADGNTLSNEL